MKTGNRFEIAQNPHLSRALSGLEWLGKKIGDRLNCERKQMGPIRSEVLALHVGERLPIAADARCGIKRSDRPGFWGGAIP